jgi:START domain
MVDVDTAKERDPQTAECRRIVQLNPQTAIDYMKTKAAMGTSARDFVSITQFRAMSDGTVVLIATSVEHPDIGATPNVVRGKLNVGGWLLQPIDGGKATKCCYLFAIDIGGSVPAMIVNAAVTQQAMSIAAVSKVRTVQT